MDALPVHAGDLGSTSVAAPSAFVHRPPVPWRLTISSPHLLLLCALLPRLASSSPLLFNIMPSVLLSLAVLAGAARAQQSVWGQVRNTTLHAETAANSAPQSVWWHRVVRRD